MRRRSTRSIRASTGQSAIGAVFFFRPAGREELIDEPGGEVLAEQGGAARDDHVLLAEARAVPNVEREQFLRLTLFPSYSGPVPARAGLGEP